MSTFKFKLGQRVCIKSSAEHGEIRGRAEYVNSENQYHIHYKAGDGRATECWWEESLLHDPDAVERKGSCDDAGSELPAEETQQEATQLPKRAELIIELQNGKTFRGASRWFPDPEKLQVPELSPELKLALSSIDAAMSAVGQVYRDQRHKELSGQ